MYTFEITVQRKMDDSWPVVVEQSASEVFLPMRNEGTVRLDLTELASQSTPKDYGLVLGRALFRDEVRDAFVQALTKSQDYLRVLLFVEADDLKILRWERLCAPLERSWDFLALTQRAPFCLYLPSLTDRRFPPIGRRDLRALVLVASPDGLERYRLQPFDVMTAVSSVRAALGAIPCEVLAGIEGTAGPPTLDALCERITAEHYTLLHVVCHSQFLRETGETVLYWATGDHRVDPVAGTRLLERLSRLQGARGLPHFAFLGTCESARAEAEGALGGLAQRLVRELGMPAVVAMTETVSVTTAQALGTAFYGRLREHGELDRALVEACAGLAERYDVMVPALYSRLGGRPLFSNTPDRPLTNEEIGFGLGRLETLLAERAPTQQEIFQTQAVNLRGTLAAEVAALSVVAGQERAQALAEVNKLCGEALDLSFDALALGQEPPAYDDRCPFRGLYPFRVEDREFFFGRETLIEHLRQKLADYPFLAVLGPSGSGKSSLVLAGLLPALQAQEPDLQMAYLTPGADPRTQLEASLASVHDGRAVLVVDQFEELFTLCADHDARQAFLDRLLALAEKRRVVLTMRADFWGECAPYHNLKDIMQARQELIAPMDVTELRQAMELQASKVGLRFEADLSHTILNDVQGEPGAMPLLQHALLELWKRRHGRWLRVEEYRAIGGVQQAMARTADDLYEQLSHGEQERVRDIFMRLTRLDDDAVPGEARRDTRRRVGLQELVPVESDLTSIRALVSRLADSRLVVTSRNEAAGREEVEVAHEALIRYWPRLRRWLDEDRASLRLRETIRQAALEWQAGGREDSLLAHRGGRLRDAEALARHPRFTFNELEQAYVDACVALRETQRAQEEAQRQRELDAARRLAAEAEARRQAEERARQEAEQRAQEQTRSTQRLRGLVAVLVLAFLIAAGVGWYAVIARNTSERQRQIALARQLAAQADLLGNRHPNLLPRSTLLALEAMQRYPTLEADQIVRHGLAILARPVGPPIQHNDHVKAVAFSPNGTYMATASWDKTARVCEAMTGREVFRLTHEGRVETVAFSPDGKYVATGGSDGVQIREITTGQTVSQIKAQEATMVVFSSDGRYLATAGGYSAQVLELPDGQQVFSTTIHDPGLSGPIGPVVFSGDGKYFATTRRGTVKVWEVGSWRTAMDIPHNGSVRPGLNPIFTPITFSPDNRYLVIAAEVYEVSSGQKVADLPQGADGSVAAVTFSLNGEHLATVSGNMARVWTVYGWGEFARVSHRDKITAIAFSPIGSSLATASEDGTARVWEVHRYSGEGPTQEVARMTHGRPVSAIAFSPDGKLLATASEDKTALVWKVTGKQEIARIAHADHMQDVGFSPNGAFLAAVNGDTVHIRDAVSGREVVHMQYGDNRDIEQVVFSPDGRYMVTLAHAHQDVDNQPRRGLQISTPVETMARVLDVSRSQEVASSKLEGVPWIIVSPDGKYLAMNDRDAASTLQVWEVARGQKIAGMKYEIGWKELDKIVFSPDGRYLTIPGEDKSVHIWETGKWQEVRSLPLKARIVRMAFSPNGKYLAAATDSPHNNIHIWKVAEWQQAGSMTHVSLVGYDLVTAMTFSHDGTYLATANKTFDEGASSNNDVRIWEVVSHREVARIQHEEEVTSLVFSGDGRYLAMGSSSIGWVWDLRNHQEVAALHSGATNVAFSPDGRYLLTADSQNKDVAVWFWQPEGLIAEACRRLTRNLTEKLEWPQYLANEPYRKTCPDLP